MTEKIYLIRHGDTVYSGQRYIGFTDAELNKAGRSNALKLSPFFLENKMDAVYSSDLKRAVQTANLIFPSEQIQKSVLLRELNFGEWETLNYKEISALDRDRYDAWLSSPVTHAPPGGETLNQLNSRITRFIQLIKGENVVIVSHTGPIILFLIKFLKKEISDFYDFVVPPASVSVLELNSAAGVKAEIDIFGSKMVFQCEK